MTPESAPRPPALGVVVAHGAMAAGLIDAVRKIAGLEEAALIAVSNEGRSPDDLKTELVERIGDRPAVVFTDLAAGSCTLAARLTCRECATVPVVTGVNLPMLLDFAFHREMPLVELAERIAGKAQDGVRAILPGPGPASAPSSAARAARETDADPAATG